MQIINDLTLRVQPNNIDLSKIIDAYYTVTPADGTFINRPTTFNRYSIDLNGKKIVYVIGKDYVNTVNASQLSVKMYVKLDTNLIYSVTETISDFKDHDYIVDMSQEGGGGGGTDPRVDTLSGNVATLSGEVSTVSVNLTSLSGNLYDNIPPTYSTWTEDVQVEVPKTDFELTSEDAQVLNEGNQKLKEITLRSQSFSGQETAIIVYDGSPSYVDTYAGGPNITFTGDSEYILLVNHRRTNESEQYEIYLNDVSTNSAPYFGDSEGSYMYNWYKKDEGYTSYSRFAEGTLSDEEVAQLPTTTITSSITHHDLIDSGSTGDVVALSADVKTINNTISGFEETAITTATVVTSPNADYTLSVRKNLVEGTNEKWGYIQLTAGTNWYVLDCEKNDENCVILYAEESDKEYLIVNGGDQTIMVYDTNRMYLDTVTSNCFKRYVSTIDGEGYMSWSMVRGGSTDELGWSFEETTITSETKTYHSGLTDDVKSVSGIALNAQTTAGNALSEAYYADSLANTINADTSAHTSQISAISATVGVESSQTIVETNLYVKDNCSITVDYMTAEQLSGANFEYKLKVNSNLNEADDQAMYGKQNGYRLFAVYGLLYFDLYENYFDNGRFSINLSDANVESGDVLTIRGGYYSSTGDMTDVYMLSLYNDTKGSYISSSTYSVDEVVMDDFASQDMKMDFQSINPVNVYYLKVWDKDGNLIHDYEPDSTVLGVKDTVGGLGHLADDGNAVEYQEGGTIIVEATGLIKRVDELESKGGSSMVYDTTTGDLTGATDTDGNPVTLSVGTVTINF